MKSLFLLCLLVLSAPGHAAEIHDLCARGDLGAVQSLLQQHPDFANARGESGMTPLFGAGNPDVMRLLLSRGLRVNEGRDPGKARITALLIQKGLDLNHRTTHQQASPLRYAARKGNIPVAEALLAYGADVNARTADYRFRSYPRGSQTLVEQDETFAPHGERTPLGWALVYHQTQFSDGLRRHGGTE